jgi:hypothetical protein
MKIFQVTFLAVLAAWTVYLLVGPLDAASNSFVHLIDLVFHEAGHPIFAPLGEFMMVLGGSLMQILVPLICAGAFLFQQDDEFGAAACVWWAGESLMDLTPYINDARDLKLMLLGGPADEVEGHDWESILTSLGWIHRDHTIARGAWWVAAMVMSGALIWSAVTVLRQDDR